MVKVHYGNKVFEYEIYENGTVKPNEEGVEEILKRVDKSILTLYACTPKGTALKRLYYEARLVE
jgi:LPXTG-site transpeptidase (sortase) family protein